MHRLKKWMIAATADEIRDLIELSATSRDYLYQITTGHRVPSAHVAGRVADAADKIRGRSGKSERRLPSLLRANLCPACAVCPHAKACKGKM